MPCFTLYHNFQILPIVLNSFVVFYEDIYKINSIKMEDGIASGSPLYTWL